MRKLTFIFATILLLLVACNTEPNNQEVTDDEIGTDEVEQDVEEEREGEEDADAMDDNGTEAESPEDAKKDENESTSERTTKEDSQSTSEQSDSWDKPEKIDNMKHLDIVHLAYDIFAAQDRKDYDFLQSVAAKGTKVDRKNDKFSFENVTYPFEMDFFSKEDLGTLELRYTHEEDGIVHVGFGAINYDEEYSFVVEFEFVKEGDAWKLLSMDINA